MDSASPLQPTQTVIRTGLEEELMGLDKILKSACLQRSSNAQHIGTS
jgi:hypothetical protein